MSSKKKTEEIDQKDGLGSIPNPDVDYVIDIPDSWYKQPHRKKMRFFIPEWDDRVDPDYVFEGEIKPHRQSTWHNTVYAHNYTKPQITMEYWFPRLLLKREKRKEST